MGSHACDDRLGFALWTIPHHERELLRVDVSIKRHVACKRQSFDFSVSQYLDRQNKSSSKSTRSGHDEETEIRKDGHSFEKNENRFLSFFKFLYSSNRLLFTHIFEEIFQIR